MTDHYIASATAGGFVTDVVVDVPPETQDGDLLLALVTSNDQSTITPPAGWTEVVAQEFEGNSVANWVYQHSADDEPANYTFSFSGDHWHFVELQVWRNVEVVSTAHDHNGGISEIVVPSLSGLADDILMVFGFHWDETPKRLSVGLTTITDLPRSIISGYAVLAADGAPPEYRVAADTSGVMAATAVLLRPVPEPVLAQNRAWSCGFELQSLVDGVEFDGGNGQIAISTDIARSGLASLRCATTTEVGFISHQVAATETSPWYLRVYVRVDALPAETVSVVQAVDDANLVVASVRLTAAGQLQLWDDDEVAGAQIGSASAPLALSVWHRVELRVGPLNGGVGARLDGTLFANTTDPITIGENINRFRLGVCTPATVDLYLDDIAINGDGAQTWPGEGHIVHMRPNAAGALTQWSSPAGDNWQEIRDLTPDDSESFTWRSASGTAADRFALAARPPMLLDTDTIMLLQVGARVGSIGTTGTRDLALTLTSPDGTTVTGSTLDCATAGWATHGVGPVSLYTLTSHLDPDATDQRWAPARLDDAEIGYTTVTSASVHRRVTALWLLVEYRRGEQTPPSSGVAVEVGQSSPLKGMPTLILEASFVSATDPLIFHLDDPTRGRLDTNLLAGDMVFEDISHLVRSADISRGSDRVSSPIVSYDAGTCALVLDNRDRRFDPTNLDGPYVVSGRSQVTTGRPMRIRARYGTRDNLITNPHFADGTTTGWTSNGETSLSVASDVDPPPLFGPYALAITRTGSNLFEAHNAATIVAGFTGGSIGEGEQVTLSVYLYIPSEVFEHIVGVSLVGASGTFAEDAIASSFVPAPPEPDAWHRVSLTGTVLPGRVLYGMQVGLWTDGTIPLGTVLAYAQAFSAQRGPLRPWQPPEMTYDLLRGHSDAWPVTWSDPNESTTSVTFTDAFKVFEGHTLTAAETPVGAGEDTGARIDRILDALEWPDVDRDIDTGDTTLIATDLAGGGLEQMRAAAEAELGELYMTGGGKLRFRRRTALSTDFRSVHPQAVFGDRDPEVRFRDVELTTDDDQLINIVAATREGEGTTPQVARDEQSVAQYQPRTYEATLPVQDDETASAWAHFVLHQARDPEVRFDRLVLTPRSNPGRAMPLALGLEIGDRIRIRRRPPGGGDVISRDCIVRGVQHQITPDNWVTTISLQSATRTAFLVLDEPILGQLDHNALGF
ncbi:hypothetical protein [Nocardiopsis sp. NPDC057823]|uniref:hypothetical protein n=1 Tax=Nocardiopsis sp. NPDC057823 TaxID=3346256 RepID=UPI00366FBDB9